MHDRCSIGAIHYASYAPWLAAQCSPIKQPRFYRVSEWRRGCRCPPGMQFSDFYGSLHNLCTICKVSSHEAMHATPLDTPPTQQRPPGRRGQSKICRWSPPRPTTRLTYSLLSRSMTRPPARVSHVAEWLRSGMIDRCTSSTDTRSARALERWWRVVGHDHQRHRRTPCPS